MLHVRSCLSYLKDVSNREWSQIRVNEEIFLKQNIEELVEELNREQNARSNLSAARKLVKEDDECGRRLVEQQELLKSFLKHEDPKTRKNAALLLGDLKIDAVEEIFQAYREEQTRFVKSSYLSALAQMDVIDKLPELRDILEELLALELTDENRKHTEEEIRQLRKILIQYEGISRHTFVYPKEEVEVILLCNRNQREFVRKAVGEEAKVHPLGVSVVTPKLRDLERIRTYRAIVFPIHTKELLTDEPTRDADLLWTSDFYRLIEMLNKEPGPFFYRIDCGNAMSLEQRSFYGRRLGAELERLSNGMLINSASDYEIELRLIANKDGKFFPCLRFKNWKERRFGYRKNAVSASIQPSTAALIMELARPYLKENAQILDPFCGVGTMLVERNVLVPAREMYGIDIFGDAIEKARENAILAKCRINFIHRDFFDFKHDYLFDEIITDMPMRGNKSKEEMDMLYRRFFHKAQEHLANQGIIIMYTNEMGLVKKQLRINKQFTLLQETCMQKKNEFYLLIIGIEG